MKRIVLVGLMLIAGAVFVSAIGFSIGVRGGYGLGIGEMTDDAEVAINSSGYFTTVSPLFYSNGQGIKAIAGPEIALLDSLSIELLGGYLSGPAQPIFTWNDQTTGEIEDITTTASFVPVSLTMKVRVLIDKLMYYCGAGPSLGFLAKSRWVDDYDDGAGTRVRWEGETTYGTGLGYHGVVGINYALTNSLSLVAEVRGEQLTFKVKKDELKVFTVDGVDQLLIAYPDVYDRETEYVEDLSTFLNSPFDPNRPDQDLAYNVFADSISAFVGIVLRIF